MKNIFLLIGLLISIKMLADAPPGYYDSTQGLYGDDLKSALNDIIDNHTALSYTQVWNAIKDTDKDPDNPENVILLYTGWSVTNAGYPAWNREHVWAKSHGDFGTTTGPGTDIHHLRPTDPGVNSSRGNKDFDNGGTQHSVATGCYYDADSWEPRDEVKGDVARMIFYMSVRYEGEGGEIDLEVVDAVNTSPAPQHGKLSTLLEWNMIDPVDDFEMNRNDVIYEDYQGNRNPFVDDPNFANLIWQATVADFSADPNQGIAPLLVEFSDLSTSSADIIAWEWDFDNDGTIDSYAQNPQFTYDQDGIYSVTLNVENELGEQSCITKTDYILVGASNIPVTIFSDSFEDGLNWTVYSVSSSYDWEREDNIVNSSCPTSVPDGSWYMYMNNYGSNAPGNDWLISPAINLSSFDNPYFSFLSWTKYADAVPGMEVLISTDYSGAGDPTTASWQVADVILPGNSSATWTFSEQYCLDQYANNEIFIAFQYQSTGYGASSSTAWAVDDFVVEGYENVGYSPEEIIKQIKMSNYPNPFNPSTEIRLQMSDYKKLDGANLEIYNLKGQKLKTIPIPQSQDSNISIIWNGKDMLNRQVSSGIYFYKLNVKNSPTGKMLLIK